MDKMIKAPSNTLVHTVRAAREGGYIDDVGVRVYGESPGIVALQVRSTGRIRMHGKEEWHTVSHARLTLATAREVCSAIQQWIDERAGIDDSAK